MMDDKIINELKEYREKYAKSFDYDPKRIFEDIKRREEALRESGRELVSFEPKRYKKEAA